MRWWRIFLVLLLWIAPAHAHEVRPGFLKLTETEANSFKVEFRQPIAPISNGEVGGLNLKVVFPDACEVGEPAPIDRVDDYLIQRFETTCDTDISKITIYIDGIQRTLTDVYVVVYGRDAKETSALINAQSPSLTLSGSKADSVSGFFLVGVDHMLGGLDHVLFVIGLVLLIPLGWRLVSVATTFTIAHSITLGLSVLDLVKLPTAPVETGIALSIVYLAYELTRRDGARASVARRYPELVAFGFGLLHGFGFAGALGEIGMPSDLLIPALFFFNVGVEAGQLLVITVLGIVLIAVTRIGSRHLVVARATISSILTIGAAYFFIGAAKNLIS